jgi:phage terminase small subunit
MAAEQPRIRSVIEILRDLGLHLPEKRRRFVEEYLIDRNGTQAAIRAGYSPKSATEQASCLLRVPNVAAVVKAASEETSEVCAITAEYVLTSLKTVADRCMQAAPVMVFAGKEGMVQKTDEAGNHVWEFDSQGANKSLELLGKYKKLFTDKVEASGPNGGPVEVVISDLAAKVE